MIESIFNTEIVKGDYYPVAQAWYYRMWKTFHVSHSHNRMEIMYVISGSCIITCEDNEYPMKKGDFILVDSNKSHGLKIDEDKSCRMLNVEFVLEQFDLKFPSIKELANQNVQLNEFVRSKSKFIVFKDSEAIYDVLKKLVLELEKNNNSRGVIVQILFSQLLLVIAELFYEKNIGMEDQGSKYINLALKYINENYNSDIGPQHIADHIKINVSYLQRLFKKHNGMTIVEYINNQRIEKTKQLLSSTDIPVTEICYFVGINSSQYLSRLFKKVVGTSPSEYRENSNIFNFNSVSTLITRDWTKYAHITFL